MNFIFHEYIKTLYYRWFHKADSKHWKIWIHENSRTKIINQDYLFIKRFNFEFKISNLPSKNLIIWTFQEQCQVHENIENDTLIFIFRCTINKNKNFQYNITDISLWKIKLLKFFITEYKIRVIYYLPKFHEKFLQKKKIK